MKRTLRTRMLCLMAMVALALPLVIAGPTGAAHAALPSGYQIRNFPTGIQAPDGLTDFEYTPDGGFFSLSKRGVVNWTSPAGEIRTIHRFNDLQLANDLGAITITLGHRYGAVGVTPEVWIVRVRNVGAPLGGPYGENILSRFSVRVDEAGQPTGLLSENRVLWFPNRWDTHSMNDAVVDPRDGTIWVSVGDSAEFGRVDPRAFDAQNRDSPYGRIMHMDRDGAGIAATNPEFDPANSHAWYSKTYAKGFRNPFRMRLHPTLGLPLVGDVGWNTWEEQNIVRPGGNYGWPCWEGNTRTPNYSDRAECAGVPNTNPPLFTYNRDAGMGSAAVGGLVYQGPGSGTGGYPADMRGTYFFADYSGAKIFTARINDAGTAMTVPAAEGWANNEGANAARRVGVPVSLKYAPNGDIAYADYVGNRVRRITYTSGNQSPEIGSAQYTSVDPSTGAVQFTVTASDLDGDQLSYSWDFGDGTSSTEQNPAKTYSLAQSEYTARVTVTDGLASRSATVRVLPGNRTPTLTLTTPPADQTFSVGDTVSISATATDPDEPGVTLPITWTTSIHHCSGEFYCHRHVGEDQSGPTYTATFPDHGDNTWLEIRAQTTDAAGAVVYQEWEAKPRLRTLTVTNTLGAPVSINGTLGGVRQVTVGATAGLSVPSPYQGITFSRWSDGVTSNSRELTIPDRDVALTGTYNSPIAARYAAEPALRTLLGDPVGLETGDASGRQQIYERGHMYWSPAEGVHEVHGAILGTYLAQGGMARLGVPTTDEIDAPGGAGRMNRFAGTPVNPNPAIYWKLSTGARLVVGSIHAQYETMNTTAGIHGYPRNSESTTPNGRAQYNDFENGGIYWSGATGAHSVYGAIYGTWSRLGWEAGPLGLPTTSERATADGRGRYNDFEVGSIYWTPGTGAHEVRGSIRTKWIGLGAERSVLRFPTTNELGTPDRVGRFNHFERGSIYWTPRTGAWEVHGLIRDEWARRGWERSSLGYPVSDEFAVPGGRRSNFQRGYIEWVNGRINVVVR